MKKYEVSVTKTVTERYVVEAENKEDAKDMWDCGELISEKVHSIDIYDVEEY